VLKACDNNRDQCRAGQLVMNNKTCRELGPYAVAPGVAGGAAKCGAMVRASFRANPSRQWTLSAAQCVQPRVQHRRFTSPGHDLQVYRDRSIDHWQALYEKYSN